MYIQTASSVLGRFNQVEAVLGGVIADGVLFPSAILCEYKIIADEDYTPPIDLASLQKEIINRTQSRLDDFAKSRGYDSVLSACTYVASQVPRFASDANVAVRLRDATWAKLYEILGEVESNKRPIPSGFGDIEADLPPLVWENA